MERDTKNRIMVLASSLENQQITYLEFLINFVATEIHGVPENVKL